MAQAPAAPALTDDAFSLVTALEKISAVQDALATAVTAVPDETFGGPANKTGLTTAITAGKAAIKTTREKLAQAADRQKGAKEQTPLSTIHTQDEHPAEDLPDTRRYKIEDFKGDRDTCAKDPYVCLDWIQRMLDLCQEFKLTEALSLKFIRKHAIHEAGRIVRQAVADKKTLKDVVLALEVNFGGLKHPDLALEECRRMMRREKETLLAFGTRVRCMADMATRMRTEKEAAALVLAKDSFVAALPPPLKNLLRLKLEERRRQGEPEPEFQDIVAEAHSLEAERLATQKLYSVRQSQAGAGGAIRQVAATEEEIAWEAWGPEGHVRRVSDWDQQQRKARTQQKTLTVNRVEEEGSGWVEEEEMEELAFVDEDTQEATILLVPTNARRRQINLKELNVGPSECAKCGLTGHRAFGGDKRCVLRNEPLTDTACTKCGKGGHKEAKCLRTKDLLKTSKN